MKKITHHIDGYIPFTEWLKQCKQTLNKYYPGIDKKNFYIGPAENTIIHESAVLFISDCEQGWVAVDRLGKVPFEKARPYYTDKALNRLEIEYRNMSGKPPMVVCISSVGLTWDNI